MKLFKKIAALLLIVVLSFSQISCTTSNVSSNETQSINNSTAAATAFKAFDDFTNDLFAELAPQNTITLHSLVEHPENYGINDYEVTLGSYKTEDLDGTSEYIDLLNKLKEFDRNELSESQQVTFDELLKYFQTELEYSDLYMFSTQLTPTTGIQVSLPIVFAEYSLDNKTDIDNYINLLSQTDRYFGELMEFEKLRSQKGMFMEDSIADKVIDQCETFLKNKDNNYLITTFDERIASIQGLTEKEISDYKNANAEAVNKHVLPAYSSLIDGVKALKGTNKYAGGLFNYPNGAKYYEYLLQSELGWSKSVDELDALLDKYINLSMLQMSTLLAKDSTLLDNADSFSFSLTDPKEILIALTEQIKKDFPDPPAVNYNIKYIDKSLEAYSSPAMYFLPQLDNYTDNAIYINKSNSDVSTLYSTLAHEGYPGHMYQSTYFVSLKPSPIRILLRPGGYLEGWASYCELYSYTLSDSTNSNLNSLMQANYEAILMLYSKVDLGINYYGWTLDATTKFLTKYGFTDQSIAKEMYESMIAEPGNYPKYSIGCIAFMELKNTAQTALGDQFNLKDFHKFLMDLGPVQFDLVEQKLQVWIASQK
ncbi:DUF885 domain-containing protein [[Clostridium] fimetarium]|uniref:Uncharacterized conserved protein, DUF885 familyt n=1 Tax=[Clostridium] fimetarium TaxID=99656 RepID=A0A1I0RW04_9FIRM|nr:DUF885 domain-containing protein [[Clostridium] fimetarium]SEW45515.1 Uncharacterized conserved protein, DUF885 familyt [[Clostridium] fimetarium]